MSEGTAFTVTWKEVLSYSVYIALHMLTSYVPDVTNITFVLEKKNLEQKISYWCLCLYQCGCGCVQSYFLGVAGVNIMLSGPCRVQ